MLIMEILRYKPVFVLFVISVSCVNNEKIKEQGDTSDEKTSANCPFSRILEDIFKIHNKTSERGIFLKDKERAKLFLASIANFTNSNSDKNQEELVNDIIASIQRIQSNITDAHNDKLNEAIILDVPKENHKIKPNQIRSGIEDKIDVVKHKNTSKTDLKTHNVTLANKNTTEKTKYVEILTVEPNNRNISNTSSYNIIEALKLLMPMFNSTLTKELHNITIIERNHHKNHSYSATKNISTIVVTYCDKDNLSKPNFTFNSENDERPDYEYFEQDEEQKAEDLKALNMTMGEKKDILEAAEYGMQKMHELYSVLEPKLYSMGLWLDHTNPARYVAAFNAPSEDSARYTRYGYATLQAAERLKQLSSSSNDGNIEGRTDEVQFPSASALRQSPLMQHCPLRGAPRCPPASKRYRTHDGTCNNLHRPRWGSTLTPVQRFIPPSYADDLQAPRRSVTGGNLPSAREISSQIHESRNAESPGITHMLMQFGQFLDHDVTSSSQSRGFNGSVPRCCIDGGRDFVPKEFMHPECFPIAVPPSDPFYGPRGVRCLDFVRSSPAPRDNCALGWREQINQVSAYIDGSPLYGSSARQSDNLRLFRNGMLQYGRVQLRRPILPRENRDELCRGGAVSTDCFKSGDGRVNEHPGLVAAHIVWLRQHNRMAQELAHLNPHWSDEKIYQETRKIVGAMIQHITYREFLPIVLGSEVMKLFDLELQQKGYYNFYDPKLNPSPASSFGSAAFRFGHSLVQSSMVRYDRFHRPMHNNVTLHDELTNPSNIWSMGAVDRLVFGMVNQPIQKRDEFISEELTNHLFQTPQFDFGMDLAAINIQRGRDHGVPPYTYWREPCGLSSIFSFEDLTKVMPERVIRKIKTLYRHVDDIDLFTGGMAERPVVGGLVGPTFACIIAQQFSNLRKGDRFWYENGAFDSSFTPAQLQQIRRISLAQILCRTLDTIDTIQPFVFLSPDNPDNNRISCHNGLLNNFDLSPWIEIEFDSNNIRTADEEIPTTQKPKRTKPTTTRKPATKKPPKDSSKLAQKKTPVNVTKFDNDEQVNTAKETMIIQDNASITSTTVKNIDKTKNDTNDRTNDINKDKVNNSNKTIKIDDKLDFKNKSKRFDDQIIDFRHSRPTKYTDYDYDDDTQSVQSVIINNVPHKRPYKRPVITVTENIDKYTYLINYVPRPTVSWRQTTRKNPDRDVVKVTYQNYDDTYRRPNKPYYYNRRDNIDDRNRENPNTKPTYNNLKSSARSEDETQRLTTKSKLTETTTTGNLYKLVTFGYVGNYKGNINDMTNDKLNYVADQKPSMTDITKHDTETYKDTNQRNLIKHDSISKDYTRVDNTLDLINDEKTNAMKLSTFYLYETATKPYNSNRPTRRNDDDNVPNYSKSNSKYYYVKNVLHKYMDSKTPGDLSAIKDGNTHDKENSDQSRDILKNEEKVKVSGVNIEERSSMDKMSAFEDVEPKGTVKEKTNNRAKKPANVPKTPSVAFEVIPSENSPFLWAVYEENTELGDNLPYRMPMMKTEPHSLTEIPRPIKIGSLRRRRPGRS